MAAVLRLRPTPSLDRRDELLSAIAKARAWIEELAQGRAASFAEIAEREGKAERASLAFVSARVVLAIAEGSLAGHLNATKLVKSMDCSREQEQCICGDGKGWRANPRGRTIRQPSGAMPAKLI